MPGGIESGALLERADRVSLRQFGHEAVQRYAEFLLVEVIDRCPHHRQPVLPVHVLQSTEPDTTGR